MEEGFCAISVPFFEVWERAGRDALAKGDDMQVKASQTINCRSDVKTQRKVLLTLCNRESKLSSAPGKTLQLIEEDILLHHLRTPRVWLVAS